MKEQLLAQKQEENGLVIHIQLTRGLTAVLLAAMLMVAFVGYLALDQQNAAAGRSSPQEVQSSSLGLRKFYQTKALYFGDYPDGSDGKGAGVCIAGYHFASLWEILDPSNLEYNTDYGVYDLDAGSGPTTNLGWVRTGFSADTSLTPGRANCDNWSSNSNSDYGTGIHLNSTWSTAEDIHVWISEARNCDTQMSVWCIED